MRVTRSLTVLGLAGALATTVQAAGPPRYQLVDLNSRLSGFSNPDAWDINNAGQIVGEGSTGLSCEGPRRGLVYDAAGNVRLLGTLAGGTFSEAHGINDCGQVVGSADATEGTRAFVVEDGVMRSLGTLDGRDSFGRAINQRGQIAGYLSSEAGPVDDRPFLYSDGSMVELTGLGASYSAFSVADLNNHGVVLGGVFEGTRGKLGFIAVDG